MNTHKKGFTLVEVLVTISIILVLAGFLSVSASKVKGKAQMAVEVNAARNIVVAYVAEANERYGKLMPGYQSDPEATNLVGEKLYHPVNARYPWRLMPHLEKVKGVMFYNGNEKHLDDPNSDYLVSVLPNLGMNTVFVGGHYGSGSPLRPSKQIVSRVGQFYVDRLSQVYDPAQLIVFASARHGDGQQGNFEVQPPKILNAVWSDRTFEEKAPPSQHGFVDFRWDKRAVAAMIDGSVALLNEKEMRDMRRWSNQAARENDPDYTVKVN